MGLVDDIEKYIRRGEKKSKNLGLEIEHFVVDKDGNQILFDLVTKLIEEVSNKLGAKNILVDGYVVGYITDEYTVTLEPSCQFEISIRPESEIEVIRTIYQKFIDIWQPVFADHGYTMVTAGNLPIVELGKISPEEIPLSAKKRYKYMDKYFKAISPYGRYMMRASGSTQVSVDYSSEKDLLRKLRIIQILSPVFMILMENKVSETSTLPDGEGKTHLLRTQEWDILDPARTGYYPHSFDEGFGYSRIANVIADTPLILLSKGGETTYVGNANATKLIESGVIDYDAASDDEKIKLIEHFNSMGFFHCRVKQYIEIRVADSVPIEKALAYTALLKGLLYSDKSLDILDDEIKNITKISQIQDATEAIERAGFDAVIYNNEKAKIWIDKIKDIASKALPEKETAQLAYL